MSVASSAPVTPSPTTELLGTSASCGIPPKNLKFLGKNYHLKANTSSEPGNKLGWVKCENGKFTDGEPTDHFVIYTAGNPQKNSDILLSGELNGKWGMVQYTLNDKSK